MRLRDYLCLRLRGVEDADDVPTLVVVGSVDMDLRASTTRTTERTGVDDLGRIVVGEQSAFADVLVIQGQREAQSYEVRRVGRHHARCERATGYLCGDFPELVPNAEGVVPVVNGRPVPGQEATAFQLNCRATGHWAEVRLKLLNDWVVVVPVFQLLQRVLLSIQGDGEGHCFLHDSGLGCSAPNEGIGDELCLGTLATKVAPEIISEVQEVCAPDLYHRISILRAISRIECIDSCWRIIPKRARRVHIIKLSSQRDGERDDLGRPGARRVLALNACVVLLLALLCLVEGKRLPGTFDVVGVDNLIVASEFALGIRVHFDVVLQSLCPGSHFGLPVERAASWEYRTELQSQLACLVGRLDLFPVHATPLAAHVGGSLIVLLSLRPAYNTVTVWHSGFA